MRVRDMLGCAIGARGSRVRSGLALAGLLLVVLSWPVQARAADLFTELRSFPGVVLLPPSGLVPFDGLQPWRVELNRPLPNSTLPPHGRYLVQYRQTASGDGSAQVGGTIGGGEFDDRLQMLAGMSFAQCPSDATYCTENVGGQEGAAVASELFRGLSVNGGPAVAEHVVCCAGRYWTLTWYDAGRDMTYEMVLVGPTADRYGDGIDSANATGANALTEIVSHLVPLQ